MPSSNVIKLSQAQEHAKEMRRVSNEILAKANVLSGSDNPAIAKAYARYKDALKALDAAGRQAEKDAVELAQIRPTVTPDAYQYLQEASRTEAQTLTRDAVSAARQHISEAREAWIASAQPTPADPAEARATLAALLSNVKGPEAMARLADAATVAPAALSLLGSEYGRAVALAAGIQPGREFDTLTSNIRASLAAQSPDYQAMNDGLNALEQATTPLQAVASDMVHAYPDTAPDPRQALRQAVGNVETD